MNKQKMFLIIYIIFLILTFASVIHSIVTRGNAGLSPVFMIFGIMFAQLYRNEKDKKKQKER